MEISAENYDDLLAALRSVQPVVGARGKGRTKEQVEDWITCRVLPALAKHRLLSFPLSLGSRERPDLHLVSDGEEIGMELTEVVPPALAHARAVASAEFPNAVVDRSVFTWGVPASGDATRRHLQRAKGLSGPGWAGDSVERELAKATSQAIETKTENLNKAGYQHYPKNWLAAYASSPGPALDLELVPQYLDLPRRSGPDLAFDLVLLLTDRKMLLLGETEPRLIELELL